MAISGILIPACQKRMELMCNKRRLDVYNVLELGKLCNVPFVSSRSDGTGEDDAERKHHRREIDNQPSILNDLIGKGYYENNNDASSPLNDSSSEDGGSISRQVFYSSLSKALKENGTRNFPFKTLEKAFAFIESERVAIIASGGDGKKTMFEVIVLRGVHRLEKTVVIKTPDVRVIGEIPDADWDDSYLDVDVNKGGKSEFSTTTQITGTWKRISPGSKILKLDISPKIAATLDALSVLYVNNQLQIRARFPNIKGPYDSKWYDSSTGTFVSNEKKKRKENLTNQKAYEFGLQDHQIQPPFGEFPGELRTHPLRNSLAFTARLGRRVRITLSPQSVTFAKTPTKRTGVALTPRPGRFTCRIRLPI